MRRMRHLKPREIQGCQLALDASIPGSLYDATSGGGLVAADGAVARWEDQSGNGNHVTQSTSGNRPLRRVSHRASLDALQFDGTNDCLINAGFTLTNPVTAFAFGSGNSDSEAVMLDSADASKQRFVGEEAGAFLAASTGSASLTGDLLWGALVATFSGTNGVSLQRGRLFASTTTNSTASYGGVTVGAGRDLNPAYFWNGYIVEICVFNSELNRAIRQRLNDSRSRKWRTDR